MLFLLSCDALSFMLSVVLSFMLHYYALKFPSEFPFTYNGTSPCICGSLYLRLVHINWKSTEIEDQSYIFQIKFKQI